MMFSWIIVGGLIVLAFMFLRVRHMRHKFTAVVIIILLIFLYTTFTEVINKKNVDLKTASGVEQGLKLYFSWLVSVFNNLKSLTGNAIGMSWNIKNETG